ncbi:MAG: AraC family transcriptional regulator [Polyangiaceae bacterium]
MPNSEPPLTSMQKAITPASPAAPSSLEACRFSRNFLEKIEQPIGFDALFEHLPDVYFFVKDAEGRFVRCNQAFLNLVRRTREEEVVGCRDLDFFPLSLAENYMNDDRVVLRSGKPIINRVELMRNPDGSIDWYTTTKLPLLDREGLTIGVAGTTRDVRKMNSAAAHFLSWAPVLEAMMGDYAEPHSAADLAAKVSLSVSQFNRQFKKKFNTTPRSYLTNVRINAACHLLVSTDLPISDIALQTGFYDQSHFSNQFLRRRGMAPSQYRRRYSADPVIPTPVVTENTEQGVRGFSK